MTVKRPVASFRVARKPTGSRRLPLLYWLAVAAASCRQPIAGRIDVFHMSLYGSWLHRRLVPVHDSHVVVDQGLPMTRVDVFVYRCQVCWRLFEVERRHVEETGVIVERSCSDILDLWLGLSARSTRAREGVVLWRECIGRKAGSRARTACRQCRRRTRR